MFTRAKLHEQATQDLAQLIGMLALAPQKVRNALLAREILLRGSARNSTTATAAINKWAPPRKSLAYMGPAVDVFPIFQASQVMKYNHFVYVDSAPHVNGMYMLQTMGQMWKAIRFNLKVMNIEVAAEFHDPGNSRHVMLLHVKPRASAPRPRPEKLVLEYYYDTQFEFLESKDRMLFRPMLMRKLRRAVGLVNEGAPLPRVTLKAVFPNVKEYLGGDAEDLPSRANRNKLNGMGRGGIFNAGSVIVSPPRFRSGWPAGKPGQPNVSENDLDLYSKTTNAAFRRTFVPTFSLRPNVIRPPEDDSTMIARYRAGLPLATPALRDPKRRDFSVRGVRRGLT